LKETPKFKIGDWVYDTVSNTVQKILEIDARGAKLNKQSWTYFTQLRKAITEEIEKELINQKLTEKMKAQTWAIIGEKRFLELMWQDLLSCGYKDDTGYSINKIGVHKSCEFIAININPLSKSITKKQFKSITTAGFKNDLPKWDKQFSLPEEYNEALAFAKEQLLDKYWVEEVPEYVECINIEGIGRKEWYILGKVYPVIKEEQGFNIPDEESGHSWNVYNGVVWKYFKPSTKKAYDEQMLLQEIKKKYPVGTKFYPAHVKNTKKEGAYCVITNDKFRIEFNNDIYALTDENLAYSFDKKDGNNSYNRVVFSDGKYAEILPEIKKWDVNTYIVMLKNEFNGRGSGDVTKGKIYEITEKSAGFPYIIDDSPYRINFNPEREENFTLKWFATKEEAETFVKTLATTLMFGKVEFTIKKGENFASTSYGNITREEIENAVEYLENLPSLKGYALTIFDENNSYQIISSSERIGFGCAKGNLIQLKAILAAFD